MVAGNAMDHHNLIFLTGERARLSPPETVHLVDERALANHRADELYRKWTIIDICAQDAP